VTIASNKIKKPGIAKTRRQIIKTFSAQQATNNLRSALIHCHREKITVSPFDVDLVLLDIHRLSNNRRSRHLLSTEAIINRIKNNPIDHLLWQLLDYLNRSLKHCHDNKANIGLLDIYGAITDILRLHNGETNTDKLSLSDIERGIYKQLREKC